MAFIILDKNALKTDPSDNLNNISILIFTEGTILGPKRLIDWFNHSKYAPIKDCVEKIRAWEHQGAEINYLTSQKEMKDVKIIKNILIDNQFPGKRLFYRDGREKYKDIAELVIPQILIEDDCRSIGGKWQMTITYVQEDIKKEIKSIVVKEFTGINQLPDDIHQLKYFNN